MKYYVYILARPNGKPFYVGKGVRDRVYHHEREARKGHKCHKCNIIRKIWRQGGEIQRYTVFTTDDEQEALKYEMELIALYGRPTLANITDGGEGTSGRTASPDTRKKQSDGIKRRYQSDPVYRQQVQERLAQLRARREDPSATAKEVGNRPEEIARRSEQAKQQWQTTDLRKRISETAKARWANPEFKARLSEKAKAQAAREHNVRSVRMTATQARLKEERHLMNYLILNHYHRWVRKDDGIHIKVKHQHSACLCLAPSDRRGVELRAVQREKVCDQCYTRAVELGIIHTEEP